MWILIFQINKNLKNNYNNTQNIQNSNNNINNFVINNDDNENENENENENDIDSNQQMIKEYKSYDPIIIKEKNKKVKNYSLVEMNITEENEFNPWITYN